MGRIIRALAVGVIAGLISAAAWYFVYEYTEEFALTFGFLLTGGAAAFGSLLVSFFGPR